MRASTLALTTRQRDVLDVVVRYYRAVEEPCPSTLVARRLGLHHERVRQHFQILHRKGWLRAPNAPAIPTRW
jgi:hypothetical protein